MSRRRLPAGMSAGPTALRSSGLPVALVLLLILGIAIPFAPAAADQTYRSPEFLLAYPDLPRQLIDKADVECTKPGEPTQPPSDDPLLPCPDGFVLQINQAYVWGMALVGDNLWYGTAPNYHCLVFGSLGGR